MENLSRFQKNTGVGQILDESLSRCPEREAIVFGNWRITYAELGALINQTAHYLRSLGVRKGDSVAVISRNCPEFMIAEMAIEKLGAIAVKFNWRLTPEEMEYLLDLNEVTCAFLKAEKPEWGEELTRHYEDRIRFIRLEQEGGRSALYSLLEGQPDTPIETEVALSDPAYHMHTSGTTGRPKCVVYSHCAYLNQLESMLETLAFPDGQIYQFISQLFHSACTGAYLTLATGGTLILMQQFTVSDYVESLVREKVNAIGVIPLILKSILDEADRRELDLSNLHVVNYSTCPISPDLLDRALNKLDCGFYQSYGMTEMASTVTALVPEDHVPDGSARLRSVGHPLPGAAIRIVRDDGTDCETGEAGEILVQGRGMMTEYYRQPELTAAVIEGGWYHTKDVGYLDERGYLYLRGRKDSLIISGGENIYPEEVSNVILKMPEVSEVAVYGMPDERWGEHVKASVVRMPGAELTAETLKAFCREHMPAFRIPKEIDFLDELPKNATGKVIIDRLKHREA